MNLAYRAIAQLVKGNGRIKGIYRNSWFLDPQLEKISPGLAYLRKVPLQNGARFFSSGTRKNDVRNALAMSSVRRKLYDQGKYLPVSHAYVWPRTAFLGWAEGQAGKRVV
jgi:hypothetical protein